MTSTKIEVYQYLKQFPRIHVKISEEFFDKVKKKISEEYGNLRGYNTILKINIQTLRWEFKKNAFHPFYRILHIIKDVEITEEELFDNILGFYHWGSHNECIKIPRYIEIDEFFVEGFSLYLAEGDNGSNGLTRPRKFRFTNSEVSVINRMIDWTNRYFPEMEKYVNVITPKNGNKINEVDKIKCSNIWFEIDSCNRKVKYRLCIDRAILIDLVLSLDNIIKELCSKDKNLACAYVRGMMIGEGTVYYNRSRYVRIEMRNEKEIKYVHRLFLMLGFDCKTSLRTTREDMWSIYIGARQLNKFYSEIGFGVHEKRQKILTEAIRIR